MDQIESRGNPITTHFVWEDSDEDVVTDYLVEAKPIAPVSNEVAGNEINSAIIRESTSHERSVAAECISEAQKRVRIAKTSESSTVSEEASSLEVTTSTRCRAINHKFSSASESSECTTVSGDVYSSQASVSSLGDVSVCRLPPKYKSRGVPKLSLSRAIGGMTKNRRKSKKRTSSSNEENTVDARQNRKILARSEPDLKSMSLRVESPLIERANNFFDNKSLLIEKGIAPESMKFEETYSNERLTRQADFYEIVQTERNHCRHLKNVIELFRTKVYQDFLKPYSTVLQDLLDVFNYHYAFLEKLTQMQGTGVFVENVSAELFQFVVKGKEINIDYAYALISHIGTKVVELMPKPTPVCVMAVPLRLTKWQIQLDSLIKHSKQESEEEKELLERALSTTKSILSSINFKISEYERQELLSRITKNMDAKSMIYFNDCRINRDNLAANRKFLYHTDVKLHLNHKMCTVKFILFDDLFLMVQELSATKYLLHPSQNMKTIIPLDMWLLRENSLLKNSLMLVASNGTMMFELQTTNATSKNSLEGALRNAIKLAKEKQGKVVQQRREEQQNETEKSVEHFYDRVHQYSMETDGSYSPSNFVNKYTKQTSENTQECMADALKQIQSSNNTLMTDISQFTSNSEDHPLLQSVNRHLAQNNKFLDVAVRLVTITNNQCCTRNIKDNYNFEDKIDTLRSQQAAFVQNKKDMEEKFEREKKDLEEREEKLEARKKEIERREKDAEEREQSAFVKMTLIDKYLGACVSKRNKLLIKYDMTADNLVDIMSKLYDAEAKLKALRFDKTAENAEQESLRFNSATQENLYLGKVSKSEKISKISASMTTLEVDQTDGELNQSTKLQRFNRSLGSSLDTTGGSSKKSIAARVSSAFRRTVLRRSKYRCNDADPTTSPKREEIVASNIAAPNATNNKVVPEKLSSASMERLAPPSQLVQILPKKLAAE